MLVVDASCLYEVITEGPFAEETRNILATSDELAAPAIIDVEIVSLIRRDLLSSTLAPSRADIAMAELNDWCGERFPVRPMNERVWQLRSNVRTWDAYYVALAEYLSVPLVTLDRRLNASQGPLCSFIVPCREPE
jgi:predicted nucleic acid-binding protein